MLLKTTLFEMAFIILSEDHLLDFYHRIEGSNSCQGVGEYREKRHILRYKVYYRGAKASLWYFLSNRMFLVRNGLTLTYLFIIALTAASSSLLLGTFEQAISSPLQVLDVMQMFSHHETCDINRNVLSVPLLRKFQRTMWCVLLTLYSP